MNEEKEWEKESVSVKRVNEKKKEEREKLQRPLWRRS